MKLSRLTRYTTGIQTALESQYEKETNGCRSGLAIMNPGDDVPPTTGVQDRRGPPLPLSRIDSEIRQDVPTSGHDRGQELMGRAC